MPKGSVPKREAKKAKKNAKKDALPIASPVFSSAEVEVVGKRKKRKADEDF